MIYIYHGDVPCPGFEKITVNYNKLPTNLLIISQCKKSVRNWLGGNGQLLQRNEKSRVWI